MPVIFGLALYVCLAYGSAMVIATLWLACLALFLLHYLSLRYP